MDLQRLSSLLGIDPAEHADWVKKLSERLGIPASNLHSWTKRGVSPRGMLLIKKKGFPPGAWVEAEMPPMDAKTRPYTQEEERVLPHPRGGPARDMDAGSYGAPDLGGFKVVTVVEPGDAVYIKKVEEILSSQEPATASALKANIDQFYEKVQDRKRVRSLEKRVEDLEREIKREKNCTEPSGGAGGKAAGNG